MTNWRNLQDQWSPRSGPRSDFWLSTIRARWRRRWCARERHSSAETRSYWGELILSTSDFPKISKHLTIFLKMNLSAKTLFVNHKCYQNILYTLIFFLRTKIFTNSLEPNRLISGDRCDPRWMWQGFRIPQVLLFFSSSNITIFQKCGEFDPHRGDGLLFRARPSVLRQIQRAIIAKLGILR